ncbi:Bardet-Biedl syndrome 7 protein [Pelomyxa schiedti]|nr:Bardet-Biedl syndrome 7 protein [Pelomyxa schiedti]
MRGSKHKGSTVAVPENDGVSTTLAPRDLVFTRRDLLGVGQVSRKSMALTLPEASSASASSSSSSSRKHLSSSGSSEMQSIVVGDDSGCLTCLAVINGEVVTQFKTEPCGSPVTRLEMGGPSAMCKDRVFYSFGHTVSGISAKKGKQFFTVETGMTEVIHNLFVEGPDMFVSGEYSLYHFVDAKDKDFFMSNDRINDMICCQLVNADLVAILACQDKFIRVVQGSECIYAVEVETACTAIHRYNTETPLPRGVSSKVFLYGTNKGHLGCLRFNSSGFTQKWSLLASESQSRISIINSCSFGNLCNDIIIGRDDGSLEVYSFQSTDINLPPKLSWRTQVNESIQGLECGQISSLKPYDITICTFSGKIICFSLDPNASPAPATVQAELITPQPTPAAPTKARAHTTTPPPISHGPTIEELRTRIQETRADVNRLEESIRREGERTKSKSTVSIPQIDVSTDFILDPATCTHTLSLETKFPIDCLAIRADTQIEVDVDKSDCTLHYTPPPEQLISNATPASESALIATVKVVPQNLHRVELKVRTFEGKYGKLQVFVLPHISPHAARLCTIQIKPLSLHERVNQLTEQECARPLNELKLSGNFTLSEIHALVGSCFPEVPERCLTEDITLFFRSSFTGSIGACHYMKKEAVFQTDSLSTLCTVKDFISKEATARKIAIHMSTTIIEKSINTILELLDPRLTYLFKLQQQVQLIEALKEIQMQESGNSAENSLTSLPQTAALLPNTTQQSLAIPGFLSEEYADILANASEINRAFERQPRALEALIGVLLSLYVNVQKLRGNPTDNCEADLRMHLSRDYTLAELKVFFGAP